MSVVAYAFVLLALLCALGGALTGLALLRQGRTNGVSRLEKAHVGVTASLAAASAFLLYALIACDFSVRYVADYTDRTLPLFYRITAFWAGQAGSLLFWALMAAVCGSLFTATKTYRRLSAQTRLWYLVLFLSIMAFFALLLSTWNNPFLTASPAPTDGSGLNPLLQNPGMIIHPPLLFLGYGGFAVPSCLAMAQLLSGRAARSHVDSDDEPPWVDLARPFTMTAWLFLTAGIVIGGWWAYMELGWGGYWAWDPVENASLIPWLVSTAALHTSLLDSRRGKLRRVNAFLMILTTISAFFAAYLARGNVVESLHAYAEGGVGPSLLLFVLAFLFLALYVACRAPRGDAPPLEGLKTREGFVIMTAWLLLALSAIILLGTLWPALHRGWAALLNALSSLWPGLFPRASGQTTGLTAAFYNRVCLPLFTILLALLSACPWIGWRGGLRGGKRAGAAPAAFVLSLAAFWRGGVHDALPLMAAASGVTVLATVLLMLADRSVRGHRPALAACLIHLGLALMALGIAFSGPYRNNVEVVLDRGESVNVGPYTARLVELYEGRATSGSYVFLEAELEVRRGGNVVDTVSPRRRIYAKFSRMAYAEAATHPSLGQEFYATLLGLDNQQRAVLWLSATPLVNWLWVGGALMTLAPLLALRGRPGRRGKEDDAGRSQQRGRIPPDTAHDRPAPDSSAGPAAERRL